MQQAAMTTQAHGTAAVLAVVEHQRKSLRGELKTLDSIAVKLGGESADRVPAPISARPKPKRRRRAGRPHPNSQQAAEERSEALFKFLVERGSQVAPREAREALDMTEAQVRAAGERLTKQGRMKRTGLRNHTFYEATPTGEEGSCVSNDTPVPLAATIPGRILTFAEEKDGVTLEELAADLGLSEEKVREECGKLIAEEELRMARRNGVSIFVVVTVR